jgi:hypothetical protein
MMFAQLHNKINFAAAFLQIWSVIGAVNGTKGPKRTLLFMPHLPKKMPKRIVIYAKDVENITGRKTRAARKLLHRIREKNNKQKDAFVTVKEFCLYTGIGEEEVREFLLD